MCILVHRLRIIYRFRIVIEYHASELNFVFFRIYIISKLKSLSYGQNDIDKFFKSDQIYAFMQFLHVTKLMIAFFVAQ